MKVHSAVRKRYHISKILPLREMIRLREITGLSSIYKEAFDRKGFIFIHIPKAAGSSIGEALCGTDLIGHFPYYLYKSRDSERFNSYFKFSFVRHPFERYLSAYYYLMGGGKGKADIKYSNRIKRVSKDANDFAINHIWREEFSDVIHFMHQTDFVCNIQGGLEVDKIYKMENIEEGFLDVLEKLSIDTKLETKNKGKIEKDRYLSDEAKRALYNFYKRDFSILGYAF